MDDVIWRCELTRHPVGTDTVMIGAQQCRCRGCRGKSLDDALRFLLAACIRYDERPDEVMSHALYIEARDAAAKALSSQMPLPSPPSDE